MNFDFLSNAGLWTSFGAVIASIVAAATGKASWSTAITVVITNLPVILGLFAHKASVAQLRNAGHLPPKA